MKKLLLLLLSVLVFACTDYTEDFNTINGRLDKLEQTLPSIDEQIASINAQLASLKDIDNDIKEQIAVLEKSDKATATEIANLKAKDSALEKSISDLQSYVDTQIANAKSEAAAAYATIEQYNTIVARLNALQSSTNKLGEELTAKINSEVATLNSKITELEARLDAVEEKVEGLLARIQSVSYIPRYDDNKATLKYAKRVSQVDIDFEISPKDAVEELAKVWQSAVSVKAVYTETRAVSFVDMPIVRFEADEQNGVITITASGENLEQVVSSAQKASLALDISDGNNSITSAYIPLVAKEVDILDLFVPSNEIWYTSTDDNIVEPTRPDAFDVSVISNTIKDGMGILKFDGNVTKVYLYAFCNQETQVGAENLETIKFPNGLAEIGEYAFCNCTSLAEVLVPPTLTRSKTGVFENCDNLKRVDIYDLSAWFRIAFNHTSGNPMYNGAKLYLNGEEVVDLIIPSDITTIPFATLQHCASIKSVVIPDGVTLVRANAFRKCANLATVYCKPTTPPSISFSSANTWLAFSDNARGRMIYVPRQSVEAYKSADGWKDYADYIVGYDF